MKNILKSSIILFALLSFNFAFAWGTTGHRVIAEIAENNLSCRAKMKLKKLIGKQKLAYWANWPDFIKSDTTGVWKHADPWHYVNVSPQNGFENFQKELKLQKTPNLYTEINNLKIKLKDKKLPQQEREEALRFLIHMLGDLAQPLHVGRAEDLGGNKIQLKFFGDQTNLHSLWDSKLVDFQKYSYTEFAEVLDVKTKKEKKEIQNGTLEYWFYDSALMANRIYSNTQADTNYAYDYNYKFSALMERQLYYGGLRLAKVLNEVL